MQILFFFSLFLKDSFGVLFLSFKSETEGGESEGKTDGKEAARSGRERSWGGAVRRGRPLSPAWAPSNVHVPHVDGRAGQVQLLLLLLLLGRLGVQVLLLGLAQA